MLTIQHTDSSLGARITGIDLSRPLSDSDFAGVLRALGERGVLCVSQFTLYGDARRGNRPSYAGAATPDVAEPLYDRFCDLLDAERGRFGARMSVELTNDGPVTLLLES